MRRFAVAVGVVTALGGCSGGSVTTSADGAAATEATVSPATEAPASTNPQTSPPTTPVPTTTSDDDATREAGCLALADQTVALWQSFFDDLGTMDASALGSDEWLEIDAEHAVPLENLAVEAEALGCGGSRSLLCDRLDELESAGELAEFFLGFIVDEC